MRAAWMRRLLGPVGRGRCAVAAICMVVSAAAALAQGAGALDGKTFWYLPEHDPYRTVEFFLEPRFEAPKVTVERKVDFVVLAGQRGWLQVKLGGPRAQVVFTNVRLFGNAMYKPAETDYGDGEFKRASIFDQDPDEIRKRFVRTDPADKGPGTAKGPAWKKYRENWSTLKPEPAKKRYVRPSPQENEAQAKAPPPAASSPPDLPAAPNPVDPAVLR
jgi:hypothetical protein